MQEVTTKLFDIFTGIRIKAHVVDTKFHFASRNKKLATQVGDTFQKLQPEPNKVDLNIVIDRRTNRTTTSQKFVMAIWRANWTIFAKKERNIGLTGSIEYPDIQKKNRSEKVEQGITSKKDKMATAS